LLSWEGLEGGNWVSVYKRRHAIKGEEAMDTMKITKIVGGLCGAFLIYLLINWGAESLYHVGGGEGEGYAESEQVSGYVIEVAEAEPAEAAEEGPSFEELLASADVTKGAKIFSKCKACHKVDPGVNGTGPTLFSVVNRAIGSVEGFSYSASLADMGGNWDTESLNGFLTSPKKYAPGTKMSFSGLKKETDRANLVAYLATIGN
jgi:cytochrome c